MKLFILLLLYITLIPLTAYSMEIEVIRSTTRNQDLAASFANEKKVKHRSALHAAAYQRNFARVKQLVEAGADIERRDSRGSTVLMTALKPRTKLRQMDIVKAIARSHEIITESFLKEMIGESNDQIVSYLIEQGANIHARDPQKQTPLHYAARYNLSLNNINLLIAKGADIEALTEHKDTPLHMASANPVAARALLKAGANLEARDVHGNTPLYMSCLYLVNMKLLVQAGADINTQNKNGNTPLYTTTYNGNPIEVKYLLDHGADPFIRNRQRLLPIDTDNAKNNPEIYKNLSDAMAKTAKK